MKPLDLEGLREVFKDSRTYLAMAKIEKVELATDASVLKALCDVFGQGRKVVARVTWGAIGPNAGLIQFPVVGDIVLLAFGEGDDEQGFVVARLSNSTDTIPTTAHDGSTVLRALAGKMAWLTSDTAIYLSRGDTEPTENVPLGQVLKTLLSQVLAELKALSDTLASHTHIGNLGYPTAPPTQAAAITAHGAVFNAKKGNPVDNEGILSDVSFTEK
jgi:hypothetical protein